MDDKFFTGLLAGAIAWEQIHGHPSKHIHSEANVPSVSHVVDGITATNTAQYNSSAYHVLVSGTTSIGVIANS